MLTRARSQALLIVVALLATLLGPMGAAPAGAASGDITVLGASTSPSLFAVKGVLEGPDGHLWFATQSAHLGEIDPATNEVTLHPITGDDYVYDLTVGGDGNIWFTVTTGGSGGLGQVGRYDTDDDSFTLFNSPEIFPANITTAQDGTLWVLGGGSGASRVNLNGTAGPGTSAFGSARDIMLGPDGNIWITKVAGVDAMTLVNPATGAETDFVTDDAGGNDVLPAQMTLGPDGNIWFGYTGGAGFNGGIGRYVVATDTFTYFPSPADHNIKGVTFGPDGNIWYLRGNATTGQVVRMTPTGTRTAFTGTGFPIGPASHEITFGPGDDLWAGGQTRIGRIDVGAPVDPACLPPAFTDVSTSHPFFADICWMDQEAISTGYQPGPTYKPSAAVSRQAMSAFMYRLAGSPPFSPPPANATTFGDVPASNTFFLEIEWMASEDITTGTAASPKPLYKPSAAVSRGAMSAFMYRLADEPVFSPPAANATTFGDVTATHPFYDEIEWMASEDITTGTAASPKPLYKPANVVSRAAMSAFMHRLAPLLPS